MSSLKFFFIPVACLLSIAQVSASPLVSGWVEEVALNGSNVSLKAKIDSGADNSSINLANHEHYEKDGQRWVRFFLENHNGEKIEFDRPIVRTAKIKMRSGCSKAKQERDVIELTMCLGSIQKTIQVNLVDRSHFKYQLLIGRSFLKADFLIDPSQKYLLKPSCEQQK